MGILNKYENGQLVDTIGITAEQEAMIAGGLQPSDVTGKADKVGSADVEITDTTKGYILKAPNGTRYRITVSNAGALTTTAL